MEPAEVLVTPVRPQSVSPFYDAYVAENYPTPTSAPGMQEPVRLHSSVSSRCIQLFPNWSNMRTVAGSGNGPM